MMPQTLPDVLVRRCLRSERSECIKSHGMQPALAILILFMTQFSMNAQQDNPGDFAAVNGLKMYYEVHGSGNPLVLLHGGGSTIESTFGRILPELARAHQVIAVELQAHGHTLDIDRPLSFEQDADDVAALLKQLKIEKVDVMGFSNGGTTALQIAIRHPELVNRLVLLAAAFKRSGMQPGFFDGFQNASLEKSMPQPLKDAYLRANPDPRDSGGCLIGTSPGWRLSRISATRRLRRFKRRHWSLTAMSM